METAKDVWAYLIGIGLVPLAILMSLASYGLAKWYYGISDLFLKQTAINIDTEDAKKKSDTINKALKIIKLIPIVVGIIVTIAMQYTPDRKAHDVIISMCLGTVHAFIGVTAYDTLIEFQVFKVLEAKFIKTAE